MTIAHTLAYYDTATITAVKNYSTGLVSNLYNFVTETNAKKLVLASSLIFTTHKGRLQPYSLILELTEKATLALMKQQ
jgi:hypothetical protein